MVAAGVKAGGGKKPKDKRAMALPVAVDPVVHAPVTPVKAAKPVKIASPAKVVTPVKAAAPVKVAAPAKATPPVKAAVASARPAAPKPVAPAPVVDVTPPVIEPAPPAAKPVTSAAPAPEPAPSVAPAPAAKKEAPMTETYTAATDAMKNGAEAIKSTIHTTTESAMATGKATFDQVATKSREAMEHGMKHVDEMAGMARGNVEAMLASSRAAAQGIEAIAREVADFSRKTFEETTAAARAMTTVKTPNELVTLQNDFAKTQFDAAVAEMSKLSETMVKLMGEVFEPMQARATLATDKMKAMITPGQ